MMKDASKGRAFNSDAPDGDAPPPLPASLLEPLPAPEPLLFCFAALIMRVTDGGGVNTDVVSGYNYAHSQEEAQGDFSMSVQRTYPGWSITKVTAQAVQPLAIAAAPPQE